ncbi:MAG: hypothetical protein GX458_13765 [Phyllobacteriaceae bacterium]|nr:hypothetical protein [Phyllobacteriaceae bacterium]
MNANEIARAAEARGLARLHAYLAHFANHLVAHAADVAHHRADVEETGELTRLLDAAMDDLEASRRSMARVVAHLAERMDTGAALDHHHAHDHPHRHELR